MREKIEIGIFVLVCLLVGWYYTFIETIYIYDFKLFLERTPVYFLPTLILSILGIYIAFRNYWRKSGVDVAAAYGMTGDYSSSSSYISSVILVNKKDKPLIINNFYIKISKNIFIKLNNDDDEYITLKPYESTIHKFPPRLGYFCNMSPVVGLIDVLHDKKIKKRIVLDTVDGIVICSQLKFSNVILQALNNHSTARIVGHGGKFIGKLEWPVGNNVLYFIELTTHDGIESFFTISPDKTKIYFDGLLSFDHDLLWTDKGRDHVKHVIQSALDNRKFSWISFEVHSQINELERFNEYNKMDKSGHLDLSDGRYHFGFFKYYVLGKILSYFKSRKLRKINKLRNQKK
ncbi:hypothetical protein D3C80_466450 [compost metagenome]|jgi:hypothetical protein